MDTIKTYQSMMQERIELLDKALVSYGLSSQRLPRALVDYIINIKPSTRSYTMVRRVKEMKNEARKKVSDYDDQIRPKIGNMATEVAKDIVDMIISKEKKDRFTSFYYDKMQEAISLYADPEKRKLFHQIVTELDLTSETHGHPFLKNVNYQTFTRTGDLYRAYYYAKAGKKGERGGDFSWMYTTFYSYDSNSNITVIAIPETRLPYNFTRLAVDPGIEDLGKWIQNFSKDLVDLPTNLFDERLESVLRSKLDAINICYSPNDNYSILVKKWYQAQGDLQPFYHHARVYNVFGKIFRAMPYNDATYKSRIESLADVISIEKKSMSVGRFDMGYTNQKIKQLLHKDITHNEKNIRIKQEQDIALMLHADEPYKILNLGSINDFIHETIRLEIKVHGKIIYAIKKRKDYGLLLKVVHDKRLLGLFQYIDKPEIEYEHLRFLLKRYNEIRELIFGRFYDIEAMLFAKYKEEVVDFHHTLYGPDDSNIKLEPYLRVCVAKGIITDVEKRFLKEIRGKFSNNDVPVIDELTGDNVFESLYQMYDTLMNRVETTILEPKGSRMVVN